MVLDDGQMMSFGYNYRGQLGQGNTSSEPVPKPVRGLNGRRVTQASCSYYHSVIACDNGEVINHDRFVGPRVVWMREAELLFACTTA